MTFSGLILMILCVGGATAFFAWCMWLVLATPGSSEHIHSQADIEPPDAKSDWQ